LEANRTSKCPVFAPAQVEPTPILPKPQEGLKAGQTPGKMYQLGQDQGSIRHFIDIEAKRAEGKGSGYERWAKTFNLKQAAKSLALLREHGFDSLD
jgi:hypothetical protein